MPVGSTTAPLTDTQLVTKFDACASNHIPADKLSSIKNMLANLRNNQDIKPLMASLRAS
jgi:hypothetical protein